MVIINEVNRDLRPFQQLCPNWDCGFFGQLDPLGEISPSHMSCSNPNPVGLHPSVTTEALENYSEGITSADSLVKDR